MHQSQATREGEGISTAHIRTTHLHIVRSILHYWVRLTSLECFAGGWEVEDLPLCSEAGERVELYSILKLVHSTTRLHTPVHHARTGLVRSEVCILCKGHLHWQDQLTGRTFLRGSCISHRLHMWRETEERSLHTSVSKWQCYSMLALWRVANHSYYFDS